MDGGEHEGEPGRRGGGRLNGVVDVVRGEWLREPVGLLADLDAAGGVAEDLPVFLQKANSERSEINDWIRREPVRSSRAARTSSRVTSRKWS
ncbi:hypothetical protein [Nonomuraea sp. NPDC049607]|uniref:hypothetical protein n=1 Tax=Nonomuraea sp. NPDC049607 TaxID=3154732 RepID=UPI00342045E0